MFISVLFKQDELFFLFQANFPPNRVNGGLESSTNAHGRAVDRVVEDPGKEKSSLIIQFLDFLDTYNMLNTSIKEYLASFFRMTGSYNNKFQLRTIS